MQKITPFLWFDNQAEEAANFYTSIFKNSKIGSITRYGEEGAKASGRFSKDGETMQCGWLKDKYGVSWQIVPIVLIEMLQDKDAKKSQRVMEAMLKMVKLDIRTLKQAYNGQ